MSTVARTKACNTRHGAHHSGLFDVITSTDLYILIASTSATTEWVPHLCLPLPAFAEALDYAVISCFEPNQQQAQRACQQLGTPGQWTLATAKDASQQSVIYATAQQGCPGMIDVGVMQNAVYDHLVNPVTKDGKCRWVGDTSGYLFDCFSAVDETPVPGERVLLVRITVFDLNSFLFVSASASYSLGIVVCQTNPCVESDCPNSPLVSSRNLFRPNCCNCAAQYKADGPRCECGLQSGGGSCVDASTASVRYDTTVAGNCKCGCQATHTGARCELELCNLAEVCGPQGDRVDGYANRLDTPCSCLCRAGYGPGGTDPQGCRRRYCTVNDDCEAAHTREVLGPFDPDCRCVCLEQYVGDRCETRICHVNHDCNGVGTAITGTYPDCHCTCPRRYGGRNCRTLSSTLSRSVLMSSSVSISISAIGTNSITVLPSLSASLPGSASATSTISHSLSASTSPSPSASLSASRSPTTSLSESASSTRSSTLSATVSSSLSTTSSSTTSKSRTLSASASTSVTNSDTLSLTAPSPSVTATCRDYDDQSTDDTCEVLRPLPSSAAKALLLLPSQGSAAGEGDGPEEPPRHCHRQLVD